MSHAPKKRKLVDTSRINVLSRDCEFRNPKFQISFWLHSQQKRAWDVSKPKAFERKYVVQPKGGNGHVEYIFNWRMVTAIRCDVQGI